MSESEPVDAAAVIAALADPSRRELYRIVQASSEPLGRDELAERTGLPRATAAFHLDRLVEVGALTTEFARRSGRTGPGAGRPAKFYSLAADEVSASVPPRRYDLVGDVLATAVEESDRTGTPVRDCLIAVAASRGHELGGVGTPLTDTLAVIGYKPAVDDDGGYVLTNCPFHRLASRHTDLICSANTAFVRGIADKSAEQREVWLEPSAGNCCVRIGPLVS
ncbi:MAG: helix-turn-helix domain-containing protein [Leifsonia sp.]